MKPLDPLCAPLTGMHLIEASAGTGKTYAIASLYLRLVIEAKLEPAQILVVTFTEAATKELAHRIRQRLADALALLEGTYAGEPLLQRMIVRTIDAGCQAETALRLRLALSSMDLAAIHTIHGFCRRVLQEYAFESGALFQTEFVTDDSEMLADVVYDFWRKHAPGFGPAFSAYLFNKGVSADSLVLLMGEVLRALAAPGDKGLRLPAVQGRWEDEAAFITEIGKLWHNERDALVGMLSAKGLSTAKDKLSPAFLKQLAHALDAWTSGPASNPPPLTLLGRLTPTALEAATLKRPKGETPRHRFFECIGQLLDLCQAASQRLICELLDFCRSELPERKLQAKILSFQDLITGVRDCLERKEGEWFAETVRTRFRTALIDEFQDTDPLQNMIFQKIFRHPNVGLFLIGDPKQAIYGFRGADIFAYLQAGHVVTGESFTLATNWRSSPAFVQAVNQLFEGHPRPFIISGIDYRPVAAPDRVMERLETTGETAALVFRCFPASANRPRTRRIVAEQVAMEIAGLLRDGRTGKIKFIAPDSSSSPLQARHIAVLVRTGGEGELIRRQLASLGIRAIFHAGTSVFASVEAEELGRFMEAVLTPADPRKARAALASRLFGKNAEDLLAMDLDESLLENFAARLAAWREVWLVRSFAVMFGQVMREETVAERLAKFSGGERAITNLRHLVELLQAAEAGGLGPMELLRHFQTRRRDAERAGDEELLRLESDENLVQILTIHRSKGLEFAYVFCPFLWDSRERRLDNSEVVVCHGDDGKVIVDLGSAEFAAHCEKAGNEAFAEELRLLYVAVTRARHRAVLHWGAATGRGGSTASSSPLGWLLFPPALGNDGRIGREIPKDDAGLWLPVEELARKSGGVITAIRMTPSEDTSKEENTEEVRLTCQARDYPRIPAPAHVIWSFTSLQHDAEAANEAPDHDRATIPTEALAMEKEVRSIFTFPRGARAGSCIHAILEKLDFPTASGEVLETAVERQLGRFGLDSGWREVLTQSIQNVLDTQLTTGESPLCLREINARDRLPELEFYYQIPAASGQRLRGVFNEGRGLRASGGHSFMKGYIDLVFRRGGRYYLVDYKSNHLGDQCDDYHQSRLAEEMRTAGYDMQARIYTLALHRLLRARMGAAYDYEQHFGGIWYLFLRGMQPETGPEYGVFFLRPERETVEAMDATLNNLP